MTKKEAITKAKKFLSDKIAYLEEHDKKTSKKAADAPGSMESWSDKSKDEFSQLAAALGRELEPLQKSLKRLSGLEEKILDKVEVGSLVEARMNNKKYYFLILDIGGENIDGLYLLSKDSELGKTLLGHKPSDSITWRNGEINILSIS